MATKVHTLKRYLRYYFAIFKLSYMSSAEYRADHLLRYIRISLELFFTVFTINLLFGHTKSLGGWSQNEVFLLYSIWSFIMTTYFFLTSNSNYLTCTDIRRGKIDMLLTKPLDGQFLAGIRNVHIDNLFRMLASIAIFVYAVGKLNIVWSVSKVLLLSLEMVTGMVTLYCFLFMGVVLAFATQGSEQFHIIESLMFLGRFPTDIFPKYIVPFFWSIIPLAYFSLIPTLLILGRATIWQNILSLVFPIIAVYVSRQLWKLGLRHYSSASS